MISSPSPSRLSGAETRPSPAAPSRRNSFKELFGGPVGLPEVRGDKPPLPVAPLTARIETTVQPAAAPPDAPPSDHPSPRHVPPSRRNSFQELFGGPAGTEVHGDKPPLPVAPLTARIETTTQPAATPDAPPPDHLSPEPVPNIPGTDMSVYSRIAKPLPLDPLIQAMEQAGLSPGQFKFDQVESFEVVPGHPELSYTNRQLLIRGPHGAKLFDLAWALRTPWVTAAELRIYKVA